MIAGFIEKLENTDIDFKTFLIVFFGVVFVRHSFLRLEINMRHNNLSPLFWLLKIV